MCKKQTKKLDSQEADTKFSILEEQIKNKKNKKKIQKEEQEKEVYIHTHTR